MIGTGSYGKVGAEYKLENDNFSKIFSVGGSAGHPNYFRVEGRDGSKSTFGASGGASSVASEQGARNASGVESNNIIQWSIDLFTDSVGNKIKYNYTDDVDGFRLESIQYSYDGNGNDNAKVEFQYEDRDDQSLGYLNAYTIINNKRLKTVLVHNRNDGDLNKVAQYNLKYFPSSAENRVSRIENIEKCDNVDRCLPATSFVWSTAQNAVFPTTATHETVLSSQDDRSVNGFKYADINGDGKQDLIWAEVDYTDSRIDYQIWQYVTSTIPGADGVEFTSKKLALRKNDNGGKPWPWAMVDYNLDGRSDFAIFDVARHRWYVHLSKYNATSDAWEISSEEIDIGITDAGAAFRDVNGDGTVDAVALNKDSQTTKTYLLKPISSASYGVSKYYEYVYDSTSTVFTRTPDTDVEGFDNYASGLDFNGDGRADSVYRIQEREYVMQCITNKWGVTNCNKVYPSKCPTPLPGHWHPPCQDEPAMERLILSLGDLDGDGAEDKFFEISQFSTNKDYLATLFTDLNSDGYTDMVGAEELSDGKMHYFYRLSNGKTFLPPNYFLHPDVTYTELQGSVFRMQLQAVDLNRDGYVDLAWQDTGENKIKALYWDQKNKNFPDTPVVLASVQGDEKDRYSFLDFNGDGVLDVSAFDAVGSTKVLYITYGSNTPVPSNTIATITNGTGAQTDIQYGTLSKSDHYLYRDIGKSSGSVLSKCNLNFDSAFCSKYITSVESTFYNWMNGDFAIPSESHGFGRDGNQDGSRDPVLPLNGPMYVVTSVGSSAPASTATSVAGAGAMLFNAKSRLSYYYADARIQAMGQGMLGFGALLTRDEQSGVRTTSTYRQDFPFSGYPATTEVKTESGRLLSMSTNAWRLHDWGGSGTYDKDYYQPYLFKSTELNYDLGSGAHIKTVVTENRPDNTGYGNIPKIISTVSGNGYNYQTVTDNEYGDTVYDKEKSRLTKSTVTKKRDEDGASGYENTDVRTSTFTYFDSGNQKGLLKTEALEAGTKFESITSYKYDVFGNKVGAGTKAKDPETNVQSSRCFNGAGEVAETAIYDNGRYVKEKRDCLGRKLSSVESRNLYGSPSKVRNYLNTSGTQYQDTFFNYTSGGRQYLEADNTGAFVGTTLVKCTTGCEVGVSHYSRTWGPGNGSIARVELAREYVDVLGRPIRTAKRGFDGTWIYQDIEYDSSGRVLRKSIPYKAGQSVPGWTVMKYDILGRVVQAHSPDGGISTTTYSGLSVSYKNALNQNRSETVTLLGEKASVVDHLGGRISYAYDAQGNLSSTSHNNGTSGLADDVTIVMEYDKLGRKTDMHDPDKGDWQYEYTAFGELEKQINAKGQHSKFEYDQLGRQTSRRDYLNSGQLEGETVWSYDTTAYGLGKLVDVRDNISGYVKIVAYDKFGRPSKTVTSLGVNGNLGNHYEKVTYDQYGRAYQVFDAARNDDTYTDNGVEYKYNDYGYQHKTVDAVYNGSVTRKEYHTINAIDARGQITLESFGNGVARSNIYNDKTGRIENILATSSSGKVIQSLQQKWDAVGNLDYAYDYGKGGTNSARNRKMDYSYDALNRLTKTQWYDNNNLTRTENTTYTILGNIKTKTGVGTYLYNEDCNCGPHAVTQAGNTTYQYDANGNMVRDSSGRKIAYTTFDKPYYIEKGNTNVAFAYNTDRSRYLRTDTDADGTKTTLYIGSVEKITNKDGSKEWIRYIGGGLMISQAVSVNGVVTSSNDRYLLKDHLGSLQFILDGSGMVVQSMSFDPWGARRNEYRSEGIKPWEVGLYQVLETTRGFTGHEMVDGLDIIHMNGRIYDSRLGRFLQADSIIDGPENPQGYNRYSYVHNNPLNATDPTGHNAFKELFDDILGLDSQDAQQIASAVVSIAVCWSYGPACYAAMGAGTSFATASANGASFGDAIGAGIKAGVISGISAGAFSEIGIAFGDGGAASTALGTAGWSGAQIGAAQVAAHAVTGGVLSVMQGGKFGHGFASAGLTKGFMKYAGIGINTHQNWYHVAGRTTIAAVIGGTISDTTGGKFANGAVTAAFAHLLNAEGLGRKLNEALPDAGDVARTLFKGVRGNGEVTASDSLVYDACANNARVLECVGRLDKYEEMLKLDNSIGKQPMVQLFGEYLREGSKFLICAQNNACDLMPYYRSGQPIPPIWPPSPPGNMPTQEVSPTIFGD
ncbi:hypothetical protein GCM10022414_38040 [Zhongshania borealis]|uniref:Teneurin-like YD-shell domain-containing protein n=2 Tax=Zhongshania borealis TaxID=889488 RepID=A0ABP7X8B3_9GAMM